MIAQTVNVPQWFFILGALFTAAASGGAAFAIFRQAGLKASLTTIIEANGELRKANEDLRLELTEERVKRAQLQGKLDVFIDQFAERIVTAVVETWRRTHQGGDPT